MDTNKIDFLNKVEFLSDLYDPYNNRQTGRSTMMAIAFIKLALKYPGDKIYIQDHLLGNNLGAKNIKYMIMTIVEKYQCFTINENLAQSLYVEYKPTEPQQVPEIIWKDIIGELN